MTSRLSILSIVAYCIFTVFVNYFSLVVSDAAVSWLWIYHTVIVTACGVVAVVSFWKIPDGSDLPFTKWEFLVALLAILLFGVQTLRDLNSAAVWLDEYTQLWRSLQDPVWMAADEQQPGGSYLLTRFLYSVTSDYKLAARMTGFLPIITSLYFFILLGKKSGNFLAFILVLLTLYLFDNGIKYASLEGRGVALGVASMSVMILAFHSYLRSPGKGELGLCFATSYIFLTSLGMQPVLLLGLFMVFAFSYFVLTKQREYLRLASVIFLAFLFYLPNQLWIFLQAKRLEKFNTDFLGKLIAWKNGAVFERFINYFSPQNVQYYWMGLIAITALMIFFWRGDRKKALLLLTFNIVFAFFFDIFFNVFINWPLQPWYSTCFHVFVGFSLATGVAVLFDKRLAWFFGIAILLQSATRFDYSYYRNTVMGRADYEGVLKQVGTLEDRKVYVLGECRRMSWWCPNFFIGAEFSGAPKENVRGLSHPHMGFRVQDNGMIEDSIKENREFYVSAIMDLNFDSRDDYDLSASHEKFEVKAYKTFLVVNSKVKLRLSEDLPELLAWVTKITKNKNNTKYYPYELLIWYYSNKGQPDVARKWFDEMLSLENFSEAYKKHPLGLQVVEELNQLILSSKKDNK